MIHIKIKRIKRAAIPWGLNTCKGLGQVFYRHNGLTPHNPEQALHVQAAHCTTTKGTIQISYDMHGGLEGRAVADPTQEVVNIIPLVVESAEVYGSVQASRN